MALDTFSYSTISFNNFIFYKDTISILHSLAYSDGSAAWLATPRELRSAMLHRPNGSGVFVHAYGPTYSLRPALIPMTSDHILF